MQHMGTALFFLMCEFATNCSLLQDLFHYKAICLLIDTLQEKLVYLFSPSEVSQLCWQGRIEQIKVAISGQLIVRNLVCQLLCAESLLLSPSHICSSCLYLAESRFPAVFCDSSGMGECGSCSLSPSLRSDTAMRSNTCEGQTFVLSIKSRLEGILTVDCLY